MPDGLGQLTGNVDPGNLRATLAAEAFLIALVAVSIADIASGMSGSFDERPAQVLRAILGERPTDIAVARLAHDRTQPGVSGELLGAREAGDVADLGGNGVGQKRTHARNGQEQWYVGVVGA